MSEKKYSGKEKKSYEGVAPLDESTKRALKQLGLDPDEIETFYKSRTASNAPFGFYSMPGANLGPANYGGMMMPTAALGPMNPRYGGMPQGPNYGGIAPFSQAYAKPQTGINMNYTAPDGTNYSMSVSGSRDRCYAALDTMVKGLYKAMESYGGEKKSGDGKGYSGGKGSGK